jgi:membrane associated rhomboid family serine protease
MFALTALFENFGIPFTQYFAMNFYLSEHFMPHQIITHMFMHGSTTHIFFNMFVFFMFAPHLERRMGNKKFLTYYMLTGFGAVILHYMSIYLEEFSFIQDTAQIKSAYNSESLAIYIEKYGTELAQMDMPYIDSVVDYLNQIRTLIISGTSLSDEMVLNVTDTLISIKVPQMVGASGAVFGVLAGFALFYPNTELLLFFVLPVKAKYVVLGYAAIELYLGFQNDPNDHIAHFAHLGGAFFGYLIIREWKNKRLI